MANAVVDIPEESIRVRSYLIWEREGCPSGTALDHWLRARAELEAELQAPLDAPHNAGPPLRKPLAFVVPRLPISAPPCRSIAMRIVPERRAAETSAATR